MQIGLLLNLQNHVPVRQPAHISPKIINEGTGQSSPSYDKHGKVRGGGESLQSGNGGQGKGKTLQGNFSG